MRLLATLVAAATGLSAQQVQPKPAQVGAESRTCMACHSRSTPGIVGQWKISSHSRNGVGCYECHRAAKGDKDAMDHNGFVISTIVSPKDCSLCHQKEFKEFQAEPSLRGGQDSGEPGQRPG